MKDYKYVINGNEYNVTIGEIEGNIANVEVNGVAYKVEMPEKVEAPKPVARPVARPASAPASAPASKPAASSAGKAAVKSPLPGVILDVKVNVGDTVKRGQTITMKMENNINADKDGKVTAINGKSGESVLEGTDLVVIE